MIKTDSLFTQLQASPHLDEGWLCLSSSYSGGRSYAGRISSSDSSLTTETSPGIDSAVDLLLDPEGVGVVVSSGRAGGNRSSAVHETFELVRTRRPAGGGGIGLARKGGEGSIDV